MTVRALILWATEVAWPKTGPHCTVEEAADRHFRSLGEVAEKPTGHASDDLLHVVAVLDDLDFQVMRATVPALEVMHGRRADGLRREIENAVRRLPGVEEVGWEDREVLHLRGGQDPVAVRTACQAVLMRHRRWISAVRN